MAYVRANMFYEREQWKRPLLVSVGFHGALVLAIFAASYVLAPHGSSNWGTNAGESVEAQLVSSAPIPIPAPKEQTNNIVASDTRTPTHTVPQPKEVETDDGITIKGKPPKKTI